MLPPLRDAAIGARVKQWQQSGIAHRMAMPATLSNEMVLMKHYDDALEILDLGNDVAVRQLALRGYVAAGRLERPKDELCRVLGLHESCRCGAFAGRHSHIRCVEFSAQHLKHMLRAEIARHIRAARTVLKEPSQEEVVEPHANMLLRLINLLDAVHERRRA